MGLLEDLTYKIGQVLGESKRTKQSIKRMQNQTLEEANQFNVLLESASNGNIESMFQLARCYEHGTNVVLDINEACRWYEMAARNGHTTAQFNLGVIYMGNVSAYFYDDNLAGYWFNEAANNGDTEADEVLKKYFTYNPRKNKWIKK